MTTPTTVADTTPGPGVFANLLFGAATAIALLAGCGSIDETADAASSSPRLTSLDATCGADTGLSGQALLDRLADSYRASIASHAGQRASDVRLDITYDGGAPRCVAWDRAGESARLELPVTLRVQSTDDTVDAEILGTISVLAGSDQVRFSGTAPLADEAISISRTRSVNRARDDRDDRDAAPTRVLVEGWIATDTPDFQGAIRLLRQRGPDLWSHRTVTTWGTSLPPAGARSEVGSAAE